MKINRINPSCILILKIFDKLSLENCKIIKKSVKIITPLQYIHKQVDILFF